MLHPAMATFVASLRALRAAVDAANPYPVEGWRNGGTIVACDPAARAAFDAVDAVERERLWDQSERLFGRLARDVVRDLVWFPDRRDEGAPPCPVCEDGACRFDYTRGLQ